MIVRHSVQKRLVAAIRVPVMPQGITRLFYFREIVKSYEEALKASRNLQLSQNQNILNAFHDLCEILDKKKKSLLKRIDK